MLCCWLPPPPLQLVPVTRIETFLPAAQRGGGGGETDRKEEKGEVKGRQWRREDRREEKAEKKRSQMRRDRRSQRDTGGTCGPSLVRVSWVPEDRWFLGSRKVDASTPLIEGRAWAHEQWVGQCSPTTEGKTLQSAPRLASATPGGVVQVSKVPGTGRVNNSIFPRVTAMMAKTVSLNQPDPALDGRPVCQILTGS